MRSLRLHLMLMLGLAITLATVVQLVVSLRTSMQEANKLFDYHMRQMASALSESTLEETKLYPANDTKENRFGFIVQVWTEKGLRVYQSRPYKYLPEQGDEGYANVELTNGEWRTYTLRLNTRVIQVAQKTSERTERAMSLALHALWPVLATFVVLLAAIWWVISWVLSPIARVEAELAMRDADSLKPVSAERLPSEIRALVEALNSLFVRMDHALHVQRRFVADAAHELRSPLTALKLQVQTLARARNDAARAQAVERLQGGIDRASRLVEQLLLLARENPSAREAKLEPVSLAGCVAQAVSDVAPMAAARMIELRDQVVPGVVLGEAESLRILIRNLLDNAIRYTPHRGVVRTAVGRSGGKLILTVEDSGPGIPAEYHARIFDQFYRIPGTVATGSGLGLAIVKTIAERHHAGVALGTSVLGGLAVSIFFAEASAQDQPPHPEEPGPDAVPLKRPVA